MNDRLSTLKCWAVALTALLATNVAGATPVHGTLTAQAVGADDASTTGTVGLLLLLHATGKDPLAESGFRLHSPTLLSIEADHTDVYSRGVVVGPPIEPTSLHDGPGWLNGTTTRQAYRLWLTPISGLPAPTIEIHGPAALTPPPTEEIVLEPKVKNDRGDQSINLARQAGWDSPGVVKATIRGDFRIALWEWDALLDASGRHELLQSGVQGPAADARTGSASEIYVTARNATLTLPLASGTHDLYLNAPRIEATSWRFHDATGTMPRVLGTVEGDVRVDGSLAATVAGTATNAPLVVDVEGEPERVMVNGEAVSVFVPDAPEANSWTSGAAGVVAAALVAFVAVVVLWATRRKGVTQRAKEGGAGAASKTNPWPRPLEHDAEAKAQVLAVVGEAPGIVVRRMLERVLVSKERALRAKDDLLSAGALVLHKEGNRHHLLLPTPELDVTRQQLAALQGQEPRRLFWWLAGNPNATWSDVLGRASKWGWPESTTRDRLRCLVDAGLVLRGGSARRGTFRVAAGTFPA